MSHSCILVRLRRPLAGGREHVPFEEQSSLSIPLGPLSEICAALLAHEDFEGVLPPARGGAGNPAAPGPPRRADADPERAHCLRFLRGSGVLQLHGDPVTSIWLQRGTLDDLAIVASVLGDRGPFAVFEEESEEWCSPSELGQCATAILHSGATDPPPTPGPAPADLLAARVSLPPGARVEWLWHQRAGRVLRLGVATGEPRGVFHAAGTLTCLDLVSGAPLWSLQSRESLQALHAVEGTGVIVPITGKARGLDLQSGQRHWDLDLGGEVVRRGIQLPQGRLFLTRTREGEGTRGVCLDATQGKILWSVALPEGHPTLCKLVPDGIVVAAGTTLRLLGVSAGEDLGIWRIPGASPGPMGFLDSPRDLQCSGRTAFLALDNGRSYRIRLEVGSRAETLVPSTDRIAGVSLLLAAADHFHAVTVGRGDAGCHLRTCALPGLEVLFETPLRPDPIALLELDAGRLAIIFDSFASPFEFPRRGPDQPEIWILDALQGEILSKSPWGSATLQLGTPLRHESSWITPLGPPVGREGPGGVVRLRM